MSTAGTADAVRSAVGAVTEPVVGRPLAELGLVHDVRLRGGGRAHVRVGLVTGDHPGGDGLRGAVADAARAVPGIRRATVDLEPLPVRARAELAERLRSGCPPVGRTPRIYAVASGKGGVGKSTITANLAARLASRGERVGLLDADVWGYSIPALFGVRHNPVAVGGLMLPVRAHGVRLMSTGFFVNDSEPVMWRGPMLHKALEQFLTDVYWDELDVLLLDLPPGTGDITLSLLELVPDAALIAVTTPQPAARTVASRVARMARDTGMPVAGVIENMTAALCDLCGHATDLFGSGGGETLAAEADAPLLGHVPLETAVRVAGDHGTPLVVDHPSATAAAELARIADALPRPRRSLLRRQIPLTVIGNG